MLMAIRQPAWVAKDDAKAVKLYETACDRGGVEGCVGLGGLYFLGLGA